MLSDRSLCLWDLLKLSKLKCCQPEQAVLAMVLGAQANPFFPQLFTLGGSTVAKTMALVPRRLPPREGTHAHPVAGTRHHKLINRRNAWICSVREVESHFPDAAIPFSCQKLVACSRRERRGVLVTRLSGGAHCAAHPRTGQQPACRHKGTQGHPPDAEHEMLDHCRPRRRSETSAALVQLLAAK